jgi:hypothetical protein
MSDTPTVIDREGHLRVRPISLYDQWLRRCHREGIDPDEAASAQLTRAMRREGSLLGDEEPAAAAPAAAAHEEEEE